MVKNVPAMQTWVQSLGQEDPLENGMTLRSSWVQNPMDRVTWWATVHRAAESDTTEGLKNKAPLEQFECILL